MALPSDANGLSRRNFANGIRNSFHGPYTLDSPEYLLATSHAAQPLIYDQLLVRFSLKRTSGPNAFTVGSPITVTIEPLSIEHRGRALYGLVREICDTIDTIHWSGTISKMTVEVHCIPNFLINWDFAIPWVMPPRGVVFIQPHGFLNDNYRPQSLYATPSRNIIRLPLHLSPLPDEQGFLFNLWAQPAAMRLPPADNYMQHPSDSDEDAVSWIFPSLGDEYIQPHGFADGMLHPSSPDISPVHSPAPLPFLSYAEYAEHLASRIGNLEGVVFDVDEVSSEESAYERQSEIADIDATEAIYQVEVDIADEVLNVDRTPSPSPFSTPASLPPLRLADEATLEPMGPFTSAPRVSPALFNLRIADRLARDRSPVYVSLSPPGYSAPTLRTMPYVPPPPLDFTPPPAYSDHYPSPIAEPTQ